MNLLQLKTLATDYGAQILTRTIDPDTDSETSERFLPLAEARDLYARGYCVEPITGFVWDTVRCGECDGDGDYRHDPVGDGMGYETIVCSDCGGTGWLPDRDCTQERNRQTTVSAGERYSLAIAAAGGAK